MRFSGGCFITTSGKNAGDMLLLHFVERADELEYMLQAWRTTTARVEKMCEDVWGLRADLQWDEQNELFNFI